MYFYHFWFTLQKHFWPAFGKSTIGPSLEKNSFGAGSPCKNIFGPPLVNPLLAPLWKKILSAPMFRGTCSSTEMLKGYMARESLGTPGSTDVGSLPD